MTRSFAGSGADLARVAGLAALALMASCGVDDPELGEAVSALTVADFTTSTCTTAVVIGLSSQIADEVGCMSPTSLTRFAAGSGISITSNAVLPYLAGVASEPLRAS